MRRPTLFACYGYITERTPSVVTRYRDRKARRPAAQFTIADGNAPERSDKAVTVNGTTYRLIWID
jgi:hypothetical protein